jgi:hypothetical protein
LKNFLLLWVIFALLDPDPLARLNPDPIRIRIRNPGSKPVTTGYLLSLVVSTDHLNLIILPDGHRLHAILLPQLLTGGNINQYFFLWNAFQPKYKANPPNGTKQIKLCAAFQTWAELYWIDLTGSEILKTRIRILPAIFLFSIVLLTITLKNPINGFTK